MTSGDTALAMALGIGLLVLVLGGVVWLDIGPVGRRGRALRDRQPSQWPGTLRGWLTGKDDRDLDR